MQMGNSEGHGGFAISIGAWAMGMAMAVSLVFELVLDGEFALLPDRGVGALLHTKCPCPFPFSLNASELHFATSPCTTTTITTTPLDTTCSSPQDPIPPALRQHISSRPAR
jgi:hypothetical protein